MNDLRTLSNAKQKELRKLLKRKYRQKLQQFVVEGRRAVEQILRNQRVSVSWLLFDEQRMLWQESFWSEQVNTRLSYKIDHGSYVELTDTDHPQGVVAVCEMPDEPAINDLLSEGHVSRVVVLDAIQDPGNLGTIIRTAVWFGMDAIILGKGTVDPWNPKVVRSTAGAAGTVPLISMDLKDLSDARNIQEWTCWRLEATNQSHSLKEINIPEKLMLVIGNEGNGIRNMPSLTDVASVAIPSGAKTEVESLNAGVAASIAMYTVL